MMATRKGEVYMLAESAHMVCRLNLSRVWESEFELIHHYRKDGYGFGGNIPVGMGFLVVDSKPYMIGGEKLSKHEEYGYTVETFCLDAYAIDPTDDKNGPLVPASPHAVPSLDAPKITPIVATIEGKIYALTGTPFFDLSEVLKYPHFEVLDTSVDAGTRNWQPLESPPLFDVTGGTSIATHFIWGTWILLDTMAGVCIFDTRQGHWLDGTFFMIQFDSGPNNSWPVPRGSPPLPTGTAAEFEGFYIAMSYLNDALVAYELDGLSLRSHRVLHEISNVFFMEPELRLDYCRGFVTHLGDGRVCFVLSGSIYMGPRFTVRVVVFRVSVTGGTLSVVDVECLKSFDLEDFEPGYTCFLSNIVVTYDTLEKCDIDYIESGVVPNKSKSILQK